MQQPILGESQSAIYDGYMEAEIGARVRARLKEIQPSQTQAEFAESVGIPPDAFSRSLNGKRAFTATELVDIANRLGTSAHWFVTGEADPFAIRYAGRHTFNQDTKAHEPIDWDDAHRVLSDVALAYIQAYGDRPPIQPPTFPTNASTARTRLESRGGSDFVRRLADHIEAEFEIDVVRIPGVDKGYALDVLGRQVIVLGETGSWFFENWSLAHELSHVLRRELSERGDSACDDPAAERRANSFAAEFLLPRESVAEVNWKEASEEDLGHFLWESGVSTVALKNRLANLGVVPSAAVSASLTQKTQAVIGRAFAGVSGQDNRVADRMQDASARRFPAHLIAAHKAGVAEGLLLPDTLAWMLNLNPESVASELAPTAEPIDLGWLEEQFRLPPASD